MTSEKRVVYDPGVYPNLPMEVYRQIDAMNNTGLKAFARSPAAYQYQRDHPSRETAATAIGTATHDLAIMGEESFAEHYALEPDPATFLDPKKPADKQKPRSTKAYKEAVAKLREGGKIILTKPDLDLVVGMSESILAHPKGGKVAGNAIDREITVVWNEPVTISEDLPDGTRKTTTYAVLCKGRFDWVGASWAADLKTTKDALIVEDFESALFNMGYYRQAPFYRRAFQSAYERELKAFFFLVVAKTPTFEREVLQLDRADFDLADKEIDALLRDYVRCQVADVWPRGTDDVHSLTLPPWARKKIERRAAK